MNKYEFDVYNTEVHTYAVSANEGLTAITLLDKYLSENKNHSTDRNLDSEDIEFMGRTDMPEKVEVVATDFGKEAVELDALGDDDDEVFAFCKGETGDDDEADTRHADLSIKE